MSVQFGASSLVLQVSQNCTNDIRNGHGVRVQAKLGGNLIATGNATVLPANRSFPLRARLAFDRTLYGAFEPNDRDIGILELLSRVTQKPIDVLQIDEGFDGNDIATRFQFRPHSPAERREVFNGDAFRLGAVLFHLDVVQLQSDESMLVE